MVSIIIPVFETEEYIRECLDSVVGQSYKDIEIFLIVAKSKDNSARICEEYTKKDSRIRIVDQEGSGAGEARNQGVAIAQGEYICFVDSDDWVEPSYVEKLICAMLDTDAKIVECDYYIEQDNISRIAGNSPYCKLNGADYIINAAPACWKFMYKRDFFIKNRLGFTNTVAEDLYLFADAYRVAVKISSIAEPLYHYRIRKDSFTDSAKKSTARYYELLDLFELIAERYKERGIFNLYKNELYRQLIPHASLRYRAIDKIVSTDESERFRAYSYNFLCDLFDKRMNPFNIKVTALGGYNLGRISNYLSAEPIAEIRYSFSSIVSIFSSEDENVRIKNNNPYRQAMLDKEIRRDFIKKTESEPQDILLFDMLEERFDVIRAGDSYYTLSEAYEESDNNIGVDEIISRLEDKCEELWIKACEKLCDLINGLPNSCIVVMVEIYLSEFIGNIYGRHKKEDSYVSAINLKLKHYYEEIIKRCPKIHIIKETDIPSEFLFTEENFEHGAVPSHLNDYYCAYVANRIRNIIDYE